MDDNKFNEVICTIKKIIAHHGIEIVQHHNRFYGIICDELPGEQHNEIRMLLKKGIDSGVYQKLLVSKNKTDDAMKSLKYLENEEFLSIEKALLIINIILLAIDCNELNVTAECVKDTDEHYDNVSDYESINNEMLSVYNTGMDHYINKRYYEATSFFIKADKYKDAKYYLGLCYYNCRKYTEMIELYTKEDMVSNPKALLMLGECYENGYGVFRDFSKAVDYYLKSAQFGNSTAMERLGEAYYTGFGRRQNYLQAIEWFKKNIEYSESTFDSSTSRFFLACCYYYGLGVKKSKKEALFWFNYNATIPSDKRAVFKFAREHYKWWKKLIRDHSNWVVK